MLASACSFYAPTTPKPGRYPPAVAVSDEVGDRPAPGLEIVALDRSRIEQDGSIRYTLRSTSADTWRRRWVRVCVYFSDAEGEDSRTEFETEYIPVADLRISEPHGEAEFAARSREVHQRLGDGERVVGTRLFVIDKFRGPTLARDANGPGERFTRWSKLECVGLASRNDLASDPPRMWVVVENVLGRRVDDVELRVVFLDPGTLLRTKNASPWEFVPPLEAGESARVDLDVTGIRNVAETPFEVEGRTP